MNKSKKQELLIFLTIVGIASFFRFYLMVPIATMGTILSPILGILTIMGLYLLTRELFEWRIAAVASYLMAISSWHINFSRIESISIIIPFILVYTFYFIWRGLKHSYLADFVMAGIFGGLACLLISSDFMSAYFMFLVAIIVLVLFLNHWWYLK